MTPLDRLVALPGRRIAPALASLSLVVTMVVGSVPVPAAADVPSAEAPIAKPLLDSAASRSGPTTVLAAAVADFSTVSVGLVSAGSGFNGPVQVTNAGDASHRLFVVEQRGVIKILRSGHAAPTAFLDIRSLVKFGGEQGLLALAFHPKFKTNHRFYVLFNERGTGDVIVGEFRTLTTNRNRALAKSFRRILRVSHRVNTNHNGGMLAFGKTDGLLYISIGDGGGGGDVPNNAQSGRVLLGKLLRININGSAGTHKYLIPPSNPYRTSIYVKHEIWSRGLRNPWRFSFDRSTGDLWIGDVGQDSWEEVDHATAASGNGRARNFGWHIMEGDACYQPSSGCVMTGLTLPVAVYGHGQGCAIIGGYVYRGPLALLKGAYLFSDVCSGTIWSVVAAGGSPPQTPTVMDSTGLGVTSFGEGEDGTVYLTAQNGHVYRLTAAAKP